MTILAGPLSASPLICYGPTREAGAVSAPELTALTLFSGLGATPAAETEWFGFARSGNYIVGANANQGNDGIETVAVFDISTKTAVIKPFSDYTRWPSGDRDRWLVVRKGVFVGTPGSPGALLVMIGRAAGWGSPNNRTMIWSIDCSNADPANWATTGDYYFEGHDSNADPDEALNAGTIEAAYYLGSSQFYEGELLTNTRTGATGILRYVPAPFANSWGADAAGAIVLEPVSGDLTDFLNGDDITTAEGGAAKLTTFFGPMVDRAPETAQGGTALNSDAETDGTNVYVARQKRGIAKFLASNLAQGPIAVNDRYRDGEWECQGLNVNPAGTLLACAGYVNNLRILNSDLTDRSPVVNPDKIVIDDNGTDYGLRPWDCVWSPDGNYLFVSLQSNHHPDGWTYSGMECWDMTDPDNPVRTSYAVLPVSARDIWNGERDPACIRISYAYGYCFVGNAQKGTAVFDVSDRSNIRFVKNIDPGTPGDHVAHPIAWKEDNKLFLFHGDGYQVPDAGSKQVYLRQLYMRGGEAPAFVGGRTFDMTDYYEWNLNSGGFRSQDTMLANEGFGQDDHLMLLGRTGSEPRKLWRAGVFGYLSQGTTGTLNVYVVEAELDGAKWNPIDAVENCTLAGPFPITIEAAKGITAHYADCGGAEIPANKDFMLVAIPTFTGSTKFRIANAWNGTDSLPASPTSRVADDETDATWGGSTRAMSMWVDYLD